VKTILPRKKRLEELYEIKEQLGSGAYSVVKVGIHKKTGEHFALKIIDKERLSDFDKENVLNEIEILKNYCDHPHIISLKEVYDDRRRTVLILELMTGGELLEQLRKKKFYSEKEACILARKLIEAVAHLHKNGVVHRDLKPENILFTTEEDTAELKIADFGFAAFIGDGVCKTPCGSPAYVAPEIAREDEYTKAVDVWSIGVIIYIMLCGFPPFYDHDEEILFELIKKGEFDFPSPFWKNISASAKELICLMLKMNPKERITAGDALSHPWLLGLTASAEKIALEPAEFKAAVNKGLEFHRTEFQKNENCIEANSEAKQRAEYEQSTSMASKNTNSNIRKGKDTETSSSSDTESADELTS